MSNKTVTAEFTARDMSEMIGQSLIDGDGDGESFAYLAGIAFDGMDSDRDLVDIIMEFLENEQGLDLSDESLQTIENVLRDAYTGR